MKVVVIYNEDLKQELLAQGEPEGLELIWLDSLQPEIQADVCIDLLFVPGPQRIKELQNLRVPLFIVNEVTETGATLPENFVRINGWNTFLKRPVVEAAAAVQQQPLTEKIFAGFHKKPEWVPDTPGFVTAKVVAMIINEAYRAWEEGVSSKEEIDTAMQLGTNYPYGPFDWTRRIGAANIVALLQKLEATKESYQPAPALVKEATD